MEFIDQVKFRPATVDDVDFIITTIIEAEKSGETTISSCKIFQFTEEEYRTHLQDILLKELVDYEYSLSGFLVAEYQNEVIGALGSWVEEENDVPSFMIKANEVIPLIHPDKKNEVMQALHLIKGFNIKRQTHFIQLEYAFVSEEYRRRKVFTNLIKRSIAKHAKRGVPFQGVQAILLKMNFKSYNAFKNLSFKISEEKKAQNEQTLEFYPYDTKVALTIDKATADTLIKNLPL